MDFFFIADCSDWGRPAIGRQICSWSNMFSFSMYQKRMEKWIYFVSGSEWKKNLFSALNLEMKKVSEF